MLSCEAEIVNSRESYHKVYCIGHALQHRRISTFSARVGGSDDDLEAPVPSLPLNFEGKRASPAHYG